MKMKTALYLILALFVTSSTAKNSPHGAKFKIDCAACHIPENWRTIKISTFDHSKTKFPLTGQHKTLNCKKCHTSLDFSKVKKDCNACHTDIHQGTVGQDCQRCHTPTSWIVTNVKKIHQQNGFALVGAHASANCNQCHKSASMRRFDNLRSDCYACHSAKYYATTKPNHQATRFDTDCARCHNMVGKNWTANSKGFDHAFFPLKGGHAVSSKSFSNEDCSKCHYENNFRQKLSPRCSSCHSPGKANKSTPAHKTKFAAYDCNACHNLQGWEAGVKYSQHSEFEIYSGEHKGKWTKCTDCHNNDATFKANCRKCHNFDR